MLGLNFERVTCRHLFVQNQPESQISRYFTEAMDSATQSADSLRKQIAAIEEQLKNLRAQLASVEAHDGTDGVGKSLQDLEIDDAAPVTQSKWPLSAEEYKRYGRQMIVPSIGIQGPPIILAILVCFTD